MTEPLLVSWRADAALHCSQCGTLAKGISGREARPLELRHYVAHGFVPAALAAEGIEPAPWPAPEDCERALREE
jgi:hypothetical protein